MPQENVEVVRRFMEAYAAEDWAATFDLLDEEHELFPDPSHPDAGVYRGHSGVHDYFHAWLGAWTQRSWEVERIIAAGDDVVVVGREMLRGKASGITTERRTALVQSVRDGKIVRTRIFVSEAEALEFAGVQE